MDNCWRCLKKLVCCKHDGPTVGVSQGLQNPPLGPPQSPPTALPTFEDRIKFFKKTADTWNIDALIQAIDQLLKSKLNPGSTSTTHNPCGSTDLIRNWTSAIGSGAMFLNFINEHTEKIDANDNYFQSGQGQKVVEELLQQLGEIHWIVGGLSIIAYVLNKVDKIFDNRSECLQLLKCMFDLAIHIKNLKPFLPEEEDKLKYAFILIVEGCMTCSSQLQSGKLFRFLKFVVDSRALSNLTSKINGLYRDLTLTTVTKTHIIVTEIQTTVTKVQTEQPVVLPVRLPTYPEGAVGLEKPLEELKKKIDLQTTEISASVVVIYGFGGIGKTTLAKALVATLADDLKDHKYTKVEISDDPLKNDFKSMQQRISQDCFPTYQSGRRISVRDYEEGQNHLKEAFHCPRQKPVFIFIDNALRSKDLKELLPEDLQGLPHGSRILVTTRNLAVTDLFLDRGICRYHYLVNPVAKEHAFEILGIDPAYIDSVSNHVEDVMRIAGGIPLVLKIHGARLRKQDYKVDNCLQLLKSLKDGEDVKEDNLSERLIHFVYNDLEYSTQEAFLDVCLFFSGWPRRHVEYIVGVVEVNSLIEAALVTSVPIINSIDDLDFKPIASARDDRLIVHDIIQSKGRSMGESTRIKDRFNGWSRASKSQVIKGIDIDDHVYKAYTVKVIEESELSCTNDSLRILSLAIGIHTSARSSQTFKELRYLRLDGTIPELPMNLKDLPCLTFYDGPIFEEVVRQLPRNLKYLKARGTSKYSRGRRIFKESSSNVGECTSLKDSRSIRAVRTSSLQELDLSQMVNKGVMFDGRFHFDSLNILDLQCWYQIEELPPQVCGLTSLTKLNLSGCGSLKRIPESFSNLRALKYLDLSWCHKLEEVCSGLGELKALRYLNLIKCYKLTKLPDNFGELSALEYLNLQECKLEKLPANFGQLTSLRGLSLIWCVSLKEVPSNFVHLSSLEVLWISSEVEELLAGLGQINNKWKTNRRRAVKDLVK